MKLLHQDAQFIIVYKPAGIKVYRDAASEPDALADLVRARITNGNPVYPVHRLDAVTTGVVIFAKDPKTANLIQKKFTSGEVRKTYVAVVYGAYAPGRSRISRPLKHPKTKESQRAITEVQLLDSRTIDGKIYSLLRCEPITGRFHQIRKHLDGEGFPIVGDSIYGKGRRRGAEGAAKPSTPGNRGDFNGRPIQVSEETPLTVPLEVNSKSPNRPGLSPPFGEGLALAAVAVEFIHPITRQTVRAEAYPEGEFGIWIKRALPSLVKRPSNF